MELLLVFLAFIGLLAIIPLAIIFNAFVLYKMWGWFLVPLGLPQIGMAHAWGLAILIGMFTVRSKIQSKDKKERIAEGVTMALSPFMALLFGYIAHRMMM